MRTYVVTGSASGIGAATRAILETSGHRVVGVDLDDAEIIVDLASRRDRGTIVDRLRDMGVTAVDGVLAAAGLSAGLAPAERVLAVNFFGAVSTVTQLRPLLSESLSPRACMVSSIGLISTPDDELIRHCVDGAEDEAFEDLARNRTWIYERSKRAISAWVRRNGVAAEWLERGILINAIAPGLIETRMSAAITASPTSLANLFASYPHPRGAGKATDVGHLAAFMLSAENAYMAGQTIFLDGGHEAICGPAQLPLRPVLPEKTSSAIARDQSGPAPNIR